MLEEDEMDSDGVHNAGRIRSNNLHRPAASPKPDVRWREVEVEWDARLQADSCAHFHRRLSVRSFCLSCTAVHLQELQRGIPG